MSPSSSIRDFAQFAGRFLWPRSAADLTDATRCPACRTPLPGQVCPGCALDLRHPASADLLTASTDAAAALELRVQLIGRIRYEVRETQAAAAAERERIALQAAGAAQAERARLAEQTAPEQTAPPAAAARAAQTEGAAQPLVTASAAAGAPAAAVAPGGAGVVSPPPAPAPPAPASPDGPAPHKRSGVQIVLLLVGVTLVSVAAIFFLTVAWLFAGLAFRSVVVGLFTVAALAVAALLRRKKLIATAEGIGSLAVVLVLLDAWAVRQNNLAGLGDGDGLLYWGVALSLCTVVFLAWHALSSLRVASVAGFAAAAPALGLLAAGLATDQDTITRLFLAGLGAAVGALGHRFTLPGSGKHWPNLNRKPERVTLLTLAALALGTGLGTGAVVRPDLSWVPLLTLGLVALVALAHAIGILSHPTNTAGSRVFAYCATGTAVFALTLGAILAAVRMEDTGLLFTVPLLAPALVGLALELCWRRTPPTPVPTPAPPAEPAPAPRRTALLVGALTATAVAATTLLGILLVAAVPLLMSLTAGLVSSPGDRIVEAPTESLWALGSLATAGALLAAFWLVGGLQGWRRRTLVAVGLAVLLLAVPFTAWLWLILPLFVALGGFALALLLLRPRRALGGNRPALIGFVVLAEASAWCVSWASSTSWWLGALSAVAALIIGRLLFDRTSQAAGRAVLLGGAILVTLVAAGTAPWALSLAARPDADLLWLQICVGVAVGTALLQLVSALPRIGAVSLTGAERQWAFFTLLPTTLLAVLAPTGTILTVFGLSRTEVPPLVLPLGLAAAVILTLGMLCWPLLAGNRPGLRWPRFIAAVLFAPAVLVVIDALVWLSATSATVLALVVLAAPTAALLALALALVLRVTRRLGRGQLGFELGALAVFAAAVPRLDLTDLTWLVLLFAAVGALLSSIAADGLFASTSWRRHLGWLALALGTVSLWWGLGRDNGIPVEAYTLPVAGMLLLLAALLWRFGRVDRAVTASPGAALLTLAGLLVALLPLAITGQSGSVVRPVIVATVSAGLLLGAVLMRWAPVRSAYLAAAGLAGALGLLVAVSARVLPHINEKVPSAELEAWLVPALVVGVAAAFLLVRHTDARTRRVRELAAVALLLAFVTVPTLFEIASFGGAAPDDSAAAALGIGRALVLPALLAAGHVLALRWPRAPLGPVTGWVLAALAATAGAGALVIAWVEPFEWVTVTLGLALVVGQLLDRTGARGTARVQPAEASAAAASRAHAPLAHAPSAAAPSAAAPSAERAMSDAQLAVQFKQGLIAAGLALGLLPSALASGSGPGDETGLLRAVLTVIVGGALALCGALLARRLPRSLAPAPVSQPTAPLAPAAPSPAPAAPAASAPTPSGWTADAARLVAWPATLVGLSAVLVTVAGRILPLFGTRVDGTLEAWLLPAAVLAVATGALLAWPLTTAIADPTPAAVPVGGGVTHPCRRAVGYGLMIGTVLAVVLTELPALEYAPLALIRVVLVVWLYALLHLAVFWADPSPLGRLLAWVAIGAAAVMVLAGFGHGEPNPIEIVSIPLAIALVASGLLQLDREPRSGSWPWLAPGLLVLLVPSLLLDLDHSPLWRVVGLGVLAIAVLVIGAVRRLQAPFLIGAAVLLLHGLAQLWPWISLAYGAMPWWLWLGVGGVLLIVLAARYEQRIHNLKSVALKISALR